MTARTFDRKATRAIPRYLATHGLSPFDLRIRALRFGRVMRFTFEHRGTVVAECKGRPAALRHLETW